MLPVVDIELRIDTRAGHHAIGCNLHVLDRDDVDRIEPFAERSRHLQMIALVLQPDDRSEQAHA
jgi:hypothetical protein